MPPPQKNRRIIKIYVMKRIMVIGNAGGGKSTLSHKLSKKKNLPYFSIDDIQWKTDWSPTPIEEYNSQHQKIISSNSWLIDGYGSWESVLERIEAADTIIYVSHSIWIHYWWSTKRQIKSILRRQSNTPEKCLPLSMTFQLYKMIWKLHHNQRKQLENIFKLKEKSKNIIYIKSPKELKKNY